MAGSRAPQRKWRDGKTKLQKQCLPFYSGLNRFRSFSFFKALTSALSLLGAEAKVEIRWQQVTADNGPGLYGMWHLQRPES